jgi:hypothetical protein
MSSQPEDPPNVELVEYLSDITVNIDGRAVLFAGNAAQRIHETVQGTDEGRKVIFERTIGGNTAALFAATRELFAAASHFGPVAVGVAATNLSGGASVGWAEGRNGPFISHQQPLFTASNYTRTARLSAATELDNPTALAQRMLGRLFTACTEIDGYSPFV